MKDKQQDQDFYTIAEFAKKLRLHPNTIRNAIRSGRLTAFRAGSGNKGSYRICHSEIGRIQLVDLEKIIQKIVNEKQGGK